MTAMAMTTATATAGTYRACHSQALSRVLLEVWFRDQKCLGLCRK